MRRVRKVVSMDRWRSVWALALCLFGLIGCNSPAPPAGPPPIQKRKVLLEIDRMQGTPAVELEQVINGTNVALRSFYNDAGIELDIRQDQIDLPRRDEVGLADLHAMMSAFRSVQAPPDVMRVHALVLTREREDPETLGVMFDFGEDDVDGRPREGFAIFVDPHATLPGGSRSELLLTLAHELAHCFNLHHPDWEGTSFGSGSTVESYSQADTVRWSLSANSKAHLRDDPGREVWPGRSNIGFGFVTQNHLARHRPSPSEIFSVVEPGNFRERRPAVALASALRKLAQRDRSAFRRSDGEGVQLHLEAPKETYVASEPVVLTVGLHNAGQTSQAVLPLLDPKYRFLNVEVRAPGDTEFMTFQPVLLADARGTKAHVLEPGQSIHDEARVFFGASGWMFKQPGVYEIRADYPAPAREGRMLDEHARLESNVLRITVTEPETAPDRRARQLILGEQEGLFLLLGSGDHLTKAVRNLKQAVTEAPTAVQTAAVHLALGTAALNPTIGYKSGVESQPRLEEAQSHLRAALSGVQLSALSVVKAQAELAETLDDHGRPAAAARVRTETVRRMGKYESAQQPLGEIKQSVQKPAAKPVKPSARKPQ